jgi:hypothetical protein
MTARKNNFRKIEKEGKRYLEALFKELENTNMEKVLKGIILVSKSYK